MGAVGARGHRHVLVLVCLVSACAVVSGTVSAVPLDWGLFHREDQPARRFCRLGGGVHRTVLLCGVVRGDAVGDGLRGAATANRHIIAESMVFAEFVARCSDVVADGRYQCLVVTANGCHTGIDLSLYPSAEDSLMDRFPDSACLLLDNRTSGMAISHHTGDSDRMEAVVVGWLVSGGAADGVCVAAATVAIAAGDDGTDLLSDSIAASTMEWIR